MAVLAQVVWCTPPPLQRRFPWSCIVTALLIVLSWPVVVYGRHI